MTQYIENATQKYCGDVEESEVLKSVTDVVQDHCNSDVILYFEWKSSTGVLFSILILYISLVTITNIIVVYKFIVTWNQITVSLREQNRVCVKYSNVNVMRRQTCQEVLKPILYQEIEITATASNSCPICLLDIQNQEYVASCNEGCGTIFHKDCLYSWLEYKNNKDDTSCHNRKSCPCCRKDLLPVKLMEPTDAAVSTNGFITELSTLVGYYPY